MTEIDFDVLIIGAGQAGVPLAGSLAHHGRVVGLVEREHLGGSCVNFGCTPSKAAFASAKLAYQARRAQEFGLKIAAVDVDFPAVLERARTLASASRKSLEAQFEQSGNPTLVLGNATIEGRDTSGFQVRVDGHAFTAAQLVLDTGTRTRVPPVEGFDRVAYLDAENWLDRPELPQHLAVLGGGYIGLEMAQFYHRMGSRVTVIDTATEVVNQEDEDVASALRLMLEREGIRFVLGGRIERVVRRDEEIMLALDSAAPVREVSASHVFIATGRQPNSDTLGLESIGVKTTDDGIVQTDERLATNVPGVWAAGDLRGGPQFTHTAWDDYRVLLSQLAGDGARTTDRVVPYAIFTDPSLGRVGVTESAALHSAKEIRVARFEMKNSGKAKELGEASGFIKVVVDAHTDQILGAAVLAPEGAELVHLYVDLMNARAPYTALRDAIHVHPTLAEAIQSAVANL
jgi:pyruvate/2-oxoglutarate dehydrogenase complex dihydrolipoamide dehydrogenase (E3) component